MREVRYWRYGDRRMSYQLYQFNLGSGEAQAFVLKGEGAHEGTNETIPAREMNEAMSAIRRRLRERYPDYTPPRFTLHRRRRISRSSLLTRPRKTPRRARDRHRRRRRGSGSGERSELEPGREAMRQS